ncbi:hypothetical protein [Mycobacterium malmoense]|uniref:hypothetical protein n=1 Tax=Mycobacterium malmoense TaxID=1780 RepID=UPI00114D4B1E|nr:hypothetical protein [Mycobacterium malmoense]
MTSADLRRGVESAVAAQDGQWDIDAITADLWHADYRDIDDVPQEEFWGIVARHALPDPGEAFRAELSAAIGRQSRSDREAIWTDGIVTVRARGISRVNQTLPQPTAQFRIEAADSSLVLPDADAVTWEMLWAAVCEARVCAQTAIARVTAELCMAARHCAQAEQALASAQAARARLVKSAAWMPVPDIAAAAAISPSMVYKILGKK